MSMESDEPMGHSDPPLGITEAWWAEGFRLLRDEDVSELVEKLPKQFRTGAESRARRKGVEPDWDHDRVVENVNYDIGAYYARKVVRPRIVDSISAAYWEALVGYEVKRRRFGIGRKEIEEGIGARLGADETTLSRWRTGQTRSDPSKVLAAQVVVIREELDDLDLPIRVEIVWQAVKRTMEMTLLEEWLPCLERSPQPDSSIVVPGRKQKRSRLAHGLSKREFVDLRRVMALPESDAFLQSAPKAVTSPDLQRAYNALLARFATERAGGKPSMDEVKAARRELGQLVETWARPYVLFRIGLAEGWDEKYAEYGDEYWEQLDAEAV